MLGAMLPTHIPEAIATERLFLRCPREGDGAAMHAAIAETWVTLHQTMPWARKRPTVAETEATARRFREHYLARTDLPLWMFARTEDELAIGATGLHRMDWAVPRFEIGYWVRRSYEGRGYVSEAVGAVTEFAFTTLQAQRVEIHCSHRNVRSQRVAERCVFALEGRLRNHRREPDGSLRDTLVYARVST